MAHKNENLSNPIYMAGAKAAHISQRELLAWCHEQERKPFSMVSPVNPMVKKSVPLYTRRRKDTFPNLDCIVELYDQGVHGEQGRPGEKQRTFTWKFTIGIAKPLVPQMVKKIKQDTKLVTNLPMSSNTWRPTSL